MFGEKGGRAVPGACTVEPGGHVVRARGLGNELRPVQEMERRAERHARVRVQDRAGERPVAVHGRRRHLRLLRGEAGRERAQIEIQSRGRRADRDRRPRSGRRPLAQGADHQVHGEHHVDRGRGERRLHVTWQGVRVRQAGRQFRRLRGRDAQLVQQQAHPARAAERHLRAEVQRADQEPGLRRWREHRAEEAGDEEPGRQGKFYLSLVMRFGCRDEILVIV